MSWYGFLLSVVVGGCLLMAGALFFAIVTADRIEQGPPEPPAGDVPCIPREARGPR